MALLWLLLWCSWLKLILPTLSCNVTHAYDVHHVYTICSAIVTIVSACLCIYRWPCTTRKYNHRYRAWRIDQRMQLCGDHMQGTFNGSCKRAWSNYLSSSYLSYNNIMWKICHVTTDIRNAISAVCSQMQTDCSCVNKLCLFNGLYTKLFR